MVGGETFVAVAGIFPVEEAEFFLGFIRAFLHKFVEVLLRMGASLSTGPAAHVFVDEVPVLSIELQGLHESLVFDISPPARICRIGRLVFPLALFFLHFSSILRQVTFHFLFQWWLRNERTKLEKKKEGGFYLGVSVVGGGEGLVLKSLQANSAAIGVGGEGFGDFQIRVRLTHLRVEEGGRGIIQVALVLLIVSLSPHYLHLVLTLAHVHHLAICCVWQVRMEIVGLEV